MIIVYVYTKMGVIGLFSRNYLTLEIIETGVKINLFNLRYGLYIEIMELSKYIIF
jgi:hypothetical protein